MQGHKTAERPKAGNGGTGVNEMQQGMDLGYAGTEENEGRSVGIVEPGGLGEGERCVREVEQYGGEDWERVECSAGSGAFRSVGPTGIAVELPLEVASGARNGETVTAANGCEIKNQKEKILPENESIGPTNYKTPTMMPLVPPRMPPPKEVR